MNYCSSCGQAVELKTPAGDNRQRHVCPHCDTIHYQNPRMVVGTLATWEDKILFCKRAIEPRLGYWTLPAGFLENGESADEGALRETQEEACAEATISQAYTLLSIPHINQIHLFYLAKLTTADHQPGPESQETKLLGIDEIPWAELAFPSVSFTLKRYLEDRQSGHFGIHHHAFRWPKVN